MHMALNLVLKLFSNLSNCSSQTITMRFLSEIGEDALGIVSVLIIVTTVSRINELEPVGRV